MKHLIATLIIATFLWTTTAKAEDSDALLIDLNDGTLALVAKPCPFPGGSPNAAIFFASQGQVIVACWRLLPDKTVLVNYEDGTRFIYPLNKFRVHYDD